jgi:hypothetical protein
MNTLSKVFYWFLFIALTCDLWQSLEMLFYNSVQPRMVDSIITIVFSIGIIIAYYMVKCSKEDKMNKYTERYEWIPTSEQMPPDEKCVIAYTPASNNMFIAYHREDWCDPKGKWVCLGPMGAPKIITKKVTHWMWCPEMPEVNTKDIKRRLSC